MSQDTFIQQGDRGGQAGPVREHERISVVDILRGFAILGILLVNMYSFAGMQLNPGSYTGLNRIVVILVLLFAQAKFYSLFSFLFGWGMWIQMSRAIAKGISVVPLLVRRMLILLAIGILHGIFIWTGDILTIYAVLGLLLILFRKSSERTLLIAAGLFLLIPIIVNLPGAAMDGFREWYAETTEFLRTFGSQNDGIYGFGTYQEITEVRLQAFVGGQTWFIYWIGNVFAMFLLGFYAGKKGYFENVAEKRGLFRRTQIIGLVVGLLFAGFSVLVMVRPETVSPSWQGWVRIATRTIGAPALMLFYVSTITLLSQREPWSGRLASLAPVGRMALTNYLMQSILLTLLFYGYGLALYGEIGPTVGLILTLIVYGSQIRFSAWWLERYRFGPMEWLWRTLTYGRMQPLRRGVSSSQMREIPVLSRLRRWLTAVPPLVFLMLVWIGLLLWGIGLYRWNQQLNSDIYENPFSSPSQSITETIPPDGQVADQTPADQEADDQSTAILPDVQPVEYRPGPTASSGDMQALAETFDSTRAIEQIEILASREYAGRLAGSETGRAAGDYIADRMDAYGLQPGGYDGSFFQSFPLTYTLLTGPPNLSITTTDGVVKDDYQLYEDFAPFIAGYAGGGEASGVVYWVNRCQPQDFRGLDVVGKIVLCYAAGSGAENTAYSRRALEYGAEGLLLLADPEQRPADLGYRHAEVWVRRSIPVLFVYEDAVADLFQGSSISPDMSFKDIDPSLLAVSANMSVEASEPQVVEGRNVLGVLPGRDPQFSDEVVVIGAHYDHMGISPDGTYWAGANDNASGTAAVLEIARSWNQEGYVPRRTVVFAAWDAEEWGLIGSTLYAYQPSYPLENTIASIQMDMVGTGGDTLRIDGGGVFAAQLKDIADEMEIESALTDEGRSDHIPFLRAGVPAALLIWDYSEGQTPSYHRPTDVVTVIDPEQLNAAGTLANTALLDLVESEPAIRGALLTRAKAALENDRTVFLSTSRQDQLDIDTKWFEDLQSFEPTAVGMSAENLEIEGDSAAGDVHIWVQHPGQDTEQITETLSVDLPVQFSRIGAEWQWAGPSLIWAQRPEGEALTGGVTPIDIAAPAGIDEEEASNLWKVGDEAAYQYAELARLLGLEEETDSSIILLPDAEAVRASTALSLPSDKESWIGPGLVKLVYQENISQTQSLATAMAQLLLANAGVREEAAPWLWWGLSAALQVEQDGTAVQQSIVPILYEQLRSDSAEINSSTAWAAVDYLIESAGWDGLGRFIVDLGRECDRGECQDGAGLDSALQRALGQSSDSFSQAWRDQWLSRLESAQNQLDALLSTRANAILTGDENSYLNTVYSADELLVQSEANWFGELFRSPPEAFNLAASPTALLPNGDVIAEVTATFRLPGSSDEVFHSTGLFRAVNDELRWAGPLRDSVSGERITVRYPEEYDFLGSSLLQDAEALYASLSAQIGIEDPEPIQIELLDGDEEFRTTVALSSPASGWIRGYSQAGTPTRLRLYPVSNVADYRSELAVQLARQLLNQRGVQSEWLLKGVSTYLSRPLDGGDYQQASVAALPDLVEAVQEGSTYRFDDFPDDAHLTQSRFELARVQAWDAVRYLVETYGWENLERLLELNGSGEELDSAASSALGVSLSDFSEEWATSFSEGHLPDGALEISERFDSDAVEDHIDYLAGPNLEGRLAGTEGADIAAQYILDYFEEYELIPAGDISTASYLQTFSITTTDWVQEPYFEVNGDERPYLLREEMLFSRAAITGTDIISGELVWIGAPSSGAVDLSGKLMVAIAQDDVEQQIDEANSYGAEGLILLGIKDEVDELYEKNPLGSDSIAAIPVLELSKNGTLRFLEYWGRTYMELSDLDPVLSLELTASMGAKVEEPRMAPTANVLGVIPGSDPYLSQEYIVIGAHYDHVGDDPASFDCSPAEGNSELICEETPGERYSGRNDDASGVAAMLELLRIWREAGYQPKRSILFAGWGAQEFGQLGSGHFVLSPTISLSQISSMVQLDGIGGGGGFNPGFQANRSTDMLPLHYAEMAAGYLDENTTETTLNAESDHFTFSEMGLPVLLLNWRLADENNLPDRYADGVSLERVQTVGRIAALTLMMLAQ